MTKHDSKEIGTMIQLALERYKEHVRGSGCGSSIGCFKGKEIQTYIDGRLRSDLLDLKNGFKAVDDSIKEQEKKIREGEDMNKEVLIKLNSMEAVVNKLSDSWIKIMLVIIAGNTISFGAIFGLVKWLR